MAVVARPIARKEAPDMLSAFFMHSLIELSISFISDFMVLSHLNLALLVEAFFLHFSWDILAPIANPYISYMQAYWYLLGGFSFASVFVQRLKAASFFLALMSYCS